MRRECGKNIMKFFINIIKVVVAVLEARRQGVKVTDVPPEGS